MSKSICYPLIESLKPAYKKKKFGQIRKIIFSKKHSIVQPDKKKFISWLIGIKFTILNKYK